MCALSGDELSVCVRAAFGGATISFLDCRPSVLKEPFDCDVSVGGGAICRGREEKRTQADH